MELIYHDLGVWLIGKSTDSKAVKIKIETEICSLLSCWHPIICMRVNYRT